MNAPVTRPIQLLEERLWRRMQAAWHPQQPPSGNSTPKCFSSEKQFVAWLEVAGTPLPKSGFCADCTPEHKGQMLREGRCHFPDTTWEEDEDFSGAQSEQVTETIGGLRSVTIPALTAEEAAPAARARTVSALQLGVRGVRFVRDVTDKVERPRGRKRTTKK